MRVAGAVLDRGALQQRHEAFAVGRNREALDALVRAAAGDGIDDGAESDLAVRIARDQRRRGLNHALHVTGRVEVIDIGAVFIAHIESAVAQETQAFGVHRDFACGGTAGHARQLKAVLRDDAGRARARIVAGRDFACEIFEQHTALLSELHLVLRRRRDWQAGGAGVRRKSDRDLAITCGVITATRANGADAVGAAVVAIFGVVMDSGAADAATLMAHSAALAARTAR